MEINKMNADNALYQIKIYRNCTKIRKNDQEKKEEI